ARAQMRSRWILEGLHHSHLTYVHRSELTRDEDVHKASRGEARRGLQQALARHRGRDGSTHRIMVEMLKASGASHTDLRRLTTFDLIERLDAIVSAGTIVLLHHHAHKPQGGGAGAPAPAPPAP